MSELKQITVDTYNSSAADFAEYFRGIGPRTEDINYVLSLLNSPELANVLEIGCGDGRDAKEIAPLVGSYLGIDISKSFIDIASSTVPEGSFAVADVTDFDFPPQIDAIFAFASLLHCSKEEVQHIFTKAATSQNPGGVFYISVKYAPEYFSEMKKDQFGERLFYYYNPELLEQLAGDNYETVRITKDKKGNTDWLQVAFRRA